MNFVTYLNAILTANFHINYILSQKKSRSYQKSGFQKEKRQIIFE